MVFEEISKYDTLYNKFGCPDNIIIPTNDLDAWLYYKKDNWVYNRLQIAQLQNIDAAPMPIFPRKYPVILKPIINLYGMGLNIFKIADSEQLMNHWYNNDFWMEFLEGDHLSYDIFLLNGTVQWHCCFKGYKLENNFGSFMYWESMNLALPSNCSIITDRLINFSGCINIETINGKIIECHLRMGDVMKLPNDNIIQGIINIYMGKTYDFPIDIPKIYLFPVWISTNVGEFFCKNLDRKIIDKICSKAYSYQIDHGTEAPVSYLRRVMMVSTFDYQTGLEILNDLYTIMH